MLAYLAALLLLTVGCHAQGEGRAIAFFSMNGVSGPVVLMKNATHMDVDATNLMFDSSMGDLGVDVHRLPIIVGASGSPCSESNIGEHYNPTNMLPHAGDLSGGMGGRNLSGSVKRFSAPSNLTLYGENGIIGRSLVLRNSSYTGPGEAPIVACANLVHTMMGGGNANVQPCGSLGSQNSKLTMEAVFNGRVSGRIVLRALRAGGATGRGASITSHLFYTDNSATTVGHHWHVRMNRTNGVDCSSVGMIIHRFPLSNGVSIANTSAGTAGREVHSSNDTRLMDLAGRSIAIHAHGMNGMPGPIMACATIRVVRQRSFVADFGSEGNVTIRQNSEFSSSEVMVNLKNAPSQVSINNVQTPQTSGSTCSMNSGRGTFNPFNRPSSPMMRGRGRMPTPDMYPTGDIFNKHNMSRQSQKCDSSLSLFGSNSIGRRSVTIVRGNMRMCANLAPVTMPGDQMMTAKAVFSTGGNVRGTVYVRQVRSSDGTMGITTVDSQGLKNMDGSATMNHNYHVHVNRKGYQNSSAACGGAFAAGHYNPFVVHTNGTYSTDCNPQNQLRCEVGDTSQKTGTIDLDDSAFLRQDSFMPLMGSQSVMGRSFVIHTLNKGGTRIACANIIPMSAFDTQIGVKTSQLPRGFDATRFANAVRQSSSMASAVSLLYTRSYNDTASGCTYISTAIDGTNAEAVANTLSTMDLGTEFTQSRTDCTEGVSLAQLSSAGTLSATLGLLFASLFAAIFM